MTLNRSSRGGDYQDLPDLRHHQVRERIIDDRLGVDGQKLLADHAHHWVEPRFGPSASKILQGTSPAVPNKEGCAWMYIHRG